MEIQIMKKVLAANDAWAQENRRFLLEKSICMFNVIGSPGAGKTTFLERTIDELKKDFRVGVIEGDIATTTDAKRIQKKGVPVYQINTGTACHLDANLINAALLELTKKNQFDIIFVENIGNLVCPAEFDIGEIAKIAILSVTEGDDKVQKYPLLFTVAHTVIINKMDLLKYTNFKVKSVLKDCKKFSSRSVVFQLDSLSGTGFSKWVEFIKKFKK